MIYSALIGYPTEHSLSSKLFQIYASEFNLEYAHLKIDVSPEGDNLRNALKALSELNFIGLNVTTPHKLSIVDMLDEIDSSAAKMGAVNTILIRNDQLVGFNTDSIGVYKSIEMARGAPIIPTDMVVVFGTGGAARACVSGLLRFTKNISVLFREPTSVRTVDFMKRYASEIEFFAINSAEGIHRIQIANILCNATPVGMVPDSDNSILPQGVIFERKDEITRVFFDCVYVPFQTAFLSRGGLEGFNIANGINMMIYQGVEAFRLWTNKSVSQSTIESAKQLLYK